MGLTTSISNIFRKKRKLRAYFIDQTGAIRSQKVGYDGGKFDIKNFGSLPKTYIVDNDAILIDAQNHEPVSFYFSDNPEPLPLRHQPNPDVDATGLRRIIDSKVVVDLFSAEGQKTLLLLMILLIANLVLTVVVLLVQFGVVKVAAGSAGGGG